MVSRSPIASRRVSGLLAIVVVLALTGCGVARGPNVEDAASTSATVSATCYNQLSVPSALQTFVSFCSSFGNLSYEIENVSDLAVVSLAPVSLTSSELRYVPPAKPAGDVWTAVSSQVVPRGVDRTTALVRLGPGDKVVLTPSDRAWRVNAAVDYAWSGVWATGAKVLPLAAKIPGAHQNAVSCVASTYSVWRTSSTTTSNTVIKDAVDVYNDGRSGVRSCSKFADQVDNWWSGRRMPEPSGTAATSGERLVSKVRTTEFPALESKAGSILESALHWVPQVVHGL